MGAALAMTAALLLGCGEKKDSLERFKMTLEEKSVNTADKPYTAALGAINAVANIREVSSIIEKAGKYVTLDLSACSVPNGTISDMSYIDDNVFIKGIILPNVLVSITEDAFDGCSSLETIAVSRNNPAYASADGVLFNKDKTTLILCPEGKSGAYTVPSSVTTIGYCAFESCENLTSITIPASVTSIEENAFYGCGITSITFEGSGTTMPDDWRFSGLKEAAGGSGSGPYTPQAGTYIRSEDTGDWTKQ
jgi:hypothetical protein